MICISTCFGCFYAHHHENWWHWDYCIWFPALAIVGCSFGEWVVSHVHCGGDVAHRAIFHTSSSNVSSTVHTAYHPLSKTTTNNSQCWKQCAVIQVQSILPMMDVKTPETCWDTTDWINHYLLHLVGLAFDYLSKMQGQTNVKVGIRICT
jgi:hypothetical protein